MSTDPHRVGRIRLAADHFGTLTTRTSIEQKRPPVLHRVAGVVLLAVVTARHVLPPVDEPGSHAVGGELPITVQHAAPKRPGPVAVVGAAADPPVLDGREHRSRIVLVVMAASVGREMRISPGGDVVTYAVFLALMGHDHGPFVGIADRLLAVIYGIEALERQPVPRLEIEPCVFAKILGEIRDRLGIRRTLHAVREALEKAPGAARAR